MVLMSTYFLKFIFLPQVLPIWEGTTNIMSLDFLRAVTKTKGESITALYEDVRGMGAM